MVPQLRPLCLRESTGGRGPRPQAIFRFFCQILQVRVLEEFMQRNQI